MHWKDERMLAVVEMLHGMKVIKVNGWHAFFERRVGLRRCMEMDSIRRQ
jgi:hypothetical protein